MRQDPDVILVGEIRDSKTCKIALQSALTGHLVFSTLHTNDAVGTVARLTNLGGELADMGPAINLIIAQRLIREICDKCKKTEKITPEELALIKKELPESLLKSAALKEEVKDIKIDENLKISKTKGCKLCNFTGYRNRIGIFEAFSLDDEMEKFILKNPSIAVLKDEAVKRGLITIKQDGLVKVLQGLTTIEEVERITG
jgi:type IV pilus assembly protein PilB